MKPVNLLLIVIFLSIAFPSFADLMAWKSETITAEGSGMVNTDKFPIEKAQQFAKRNANLNLQRNFLDKILDLPITETIEIREIIKNSEELKLLKSSINDNINIVEERLSDAKHTVIAELPLSKIYDQLISNQLLDNVPPPANDPSPQVASESEKNPSQSSV